MAHKTQLDFVRSVSRSLPEYFLQQRVLEVGSLDINGSIRQFFDRCDYTGIDVASGPGVDQVCLGHEFKAPEASFDVTVSCECFEHNPYWRETLANMIRLTRPGGLILLTCATTGRLEHGTTRTTPADSPLTIAKGWDYYRNLAPGDLKGALDGLSAYRMWQAWNSFDLLMIGVRQGPLPPAWPQALATLDRQVEERQGPNRRMRATVARLGGDRAFTALRSAPSISWRLGQMLRPITDQRHD
jgi:SAM-dependent methyltransferase